MEHIKKNIVITGANSGIGFALASKFAKNNNVIAADKDDFALQKLSDLGIKTFVADISKKESVDRLFEFTLDTFGDIDIFIANAGFGYFERIDGANYGRIENIFSTNVFSPIYSLQKFIELGENKDRQFVIVASGIGKIPVPGYSLYSATKAALNAFEEAVRPELPQNICLTAVYPVAINTNFYASAVNGVNVDELELPTPKQKLEPAVEAIFRGIEMRKNRIYPLAIFPLLTTLSTLFPPLKRIYWHMQYNKLLKYEDSLKRDTTTEN